MAEAGGTTATHDVEVKVVMPPCAMVEVKVFCTALEVVRVPVVIVFWVALVVFSVEVASSTRIS